MQNFFTNATIVMLAILSISCNGVTTKTTADTAAVPEINDTMPILKPDPTDSSGTIRTAPTGDENVIMPDSAINKK